MGWEPCVTIRVYILAVGLHRKAAQGVLRF